MCSSDLAIVLAEFEPVLERRLEDLAAEASDEVKSRLLDQFLEEQVFLEEAKRRGIRADDAEVAYALAGLAESEGPTGAEYREDVRSTLTVEKLLRVALQESASVTPEEVESYYNSHEEQFHRPAVLMVRQILMDDEAAAIKTREELNSEPQSFPTLAAERSLSPDLGRRLSYVVENLPEEVAAILVDVKEGEISPVIPMSDNFLILLVEETQGAHNLSLEEAMPEIRVRLLAEKGIGATTRLLSDLRQRLGLQMHTENLPFAYIEEPA